MLDGAKVSITSENGYSNADVEVKGGEIILNNLENTNAELIRMNIKQSDRLIQLNESARNQMEALKNNKNVKELEVLQHQVNKDSKYLIENK